MRINKAFKIKDFDSFNAEIGIVDKNNPKSMFCDLRFYLESSDTQYKRNINKFLKSIKNDVELNIDRSLFYDKFIMLADSPDTMKTIGKGYVTLTFNFFIRKVDDFQKNFYREKVITLMEKIETNHFLDSKLFQITKQKRF
jgi:hypothetical protein